MKKTQHLIIKIILSVAIIVTAILFWQLKFASHFPSPVTLQAKPNFWGVTFSKRYTSFLQLNWKETYTAILDDLKVKRVRLPLYWEDLETKPDVYDFSDYDWLMDQSAKRQVKVVPVLGRRQPRWPECHTPDWVKALSETKQQKRILKLIAATVDHYKNYGNIEAWQVENEPLLNSFGACPPADPTFLDQEIALVKSLDSRPIIITGSGELGTWNQEAKLGDYFGTTVYRVVWNKYFGFLRWLWPPSFYQFKAKFAKLTLDRAIIAELQSEPWAPGDIKSLSISDINKSFTPDQFRANLQFAINTDFEHAYLWGAEWWYYEKVNGHEEYWQIAKRLKW